LKKQAKVFRISPMKVIATFEDNLIHNSGFVKETKKVLKETETQTSIICNDLILASFIILRLRFVLEGTI
jgi:hypothetical protein